MHTTRNVAARSKGAAPGRQQIEPGEAGTTKLLDPQLAQPSRWANRHESSFLSADFEALKKEIASAGGNVQPIKVRPTSDGQYQIVFGHRRQRACRELGLPVLAAIVSIDDRGLWEEMERENRNRADLTPYEQGCHYRQALNEGLYPSIRKMAMSIGVDVSQASKVVRLADLPREVIEAFPTPGAIQVNWATALGEALTRDPDGMVKRAKQIVRDANKAGGTRPTAKQVLDALTRAEGVEPSQARPAEIQIGDQRRGQLATIKFGRDGLRVEFKESAVTVVALEQALRRLLKVSS